MPRDATPLDVRIGVGLRVRYDAMREVAVAAEDLGYESVWLPEHLVFPATLEGSPHAGGEHPPVRPDVPTLDVLLVLATLAAATSRVGLGTWVYNLALRHPLVAARAVQTLDVLSGGRVLFGVGAGWLRGEYEAVGVDFATRGRRLDECIDAVRVLWTEDRPWFEGQFVAFPAVVFEPKPSRVPVLVGGESEAALRRAAERGDGWIGMEHTPSSARDRVERLRALCAERGRDPVEVTVGANVRDGDDVLGYAEAGVDRVIVSPWERTADAVGGLRALAERVAVS